MTLNTSIKDYQYDRLAHIEFNRAEIWRTSTIEPLSTTYKSTYSKDVSTYLKYFTQESTVNFELGNIISSELQGAFDVQLYATYYDTNGEPGAPFNIGDLIDVYEPDSFFSIAKPASEVFVVTGGGSKYLPQDRIHVEIPKVSQNTTRLVLAIFASGNSNEEFWYTNTFTEYADLFEQVSGQFPGFGPARIVNVYLNGELIATQVPQPFIFTGGMSPFLWMPMVANNAFDLTSMDLDLTALIPKLWDGDSNFLDIEISNATSNNFNPSSPVIGSDWIVTANLLSYENENITSAKGEVSSIRNWGGANTSGNVPSNGTLVQSITGDFYADISGHIEYSLKNGSKVSSTIILGTIAKVTNNQNYKQYGSIQTVEHLGTSQRNIVIHSGLNTLHKRQSTFTYPLNLEFSYTNNTTPTGGWLVENVVNITLSKDIDIVENGGLVFHSSSDQIGHSIIDSTDSGRSVKSGMSTDYTLQQQSPFPQASYNRVVDSSNGLVTSDTVTGSSLRKRFPQVKPPQNIVARDLSNIDRLKLGNRKFKRISLKVESTK